MLKRDIICFDYETGGADPDTCQPTQLAAIGLDGRTLKEKGEFSSMIRAEVDDEKAIAAGLGPLEDEALKITGHTREEIAKAPPLKTVWAKFVQFVGRMNPSGKPFFNPVAAGWNINNYDLIINKRLCKEFGPWDKKRNQQQLFNQVYKIDVMDNMYMWFEGDHDTKSVSMKAIREKFGMSDENAHDALQDVRDTVEIMRKFMKTHRAVFKNLRF